MSVRSRRGGHAWAGFVSRFGAVRSVQGGVDKVRVLCVLCFSVRGWDDHAS